MSLSGLEWSFRFHYHRDMMNAASHMAPPQFSELTKTLCLDLEDSVIDVVLTRRQDYLNEIPGWRHVRETMI